jgi:hypothetical protein
MKRIIDIIFLIALAVNCLFLPYTIEIFTRQRLAGFVKQEFLGYYLLWSPPTSPDNAVVKIDFERLGLQFVALIAFYVAFVFLSKSLIRSRAKESDNDKVEENVDTLAKVKEKDPVKSKSQSDTAISEKTALWSDLSNVYREIKKRWWPVLPISIMVSLGGLLEILSRYCYFHAFQRCSC